jgi:hypothetical protein
VAEQPLLSIIITSYTLDRLRDIFEPLDSIKGESYDNIQTIFVAERSRELYEKVKEGENTFGVRRYQNVSEIYRCNNKGGGAICRLVS